MNGSRWDVDTISDGYLDFDGVAFIIELVAELERQQTENIELAHDTAIAYKQGYVAGAVSVMHDVEMVE